MKLIKQKFVCFFLPVFFFSLANASLVYSSDLRVISYNVWFNQSTAKQRIPEILDIIAEKKADIIALQEAESWILDFIINDRRFNEYQLIYHKTWRYHLFGSLSGGLLFLSRFEPKSIHYQALPSSMGRGMLSFKSRLADIELCVTSVHLDSMLDDTQQRIEQLIQIEKYHASCENVILLGDFNFGDADPENNILANHYRDVWKALHPEQAGFTWDLNNNSLARTNSFVGEGSSRLDRIFVKSQRLQEKMIEILGTRSFSSSYGSLYPSDHFGLMSVIEFH